MYRVDRNNFYQNEKKPNIYTPSKTSDYLFSILEGKVDKNGLIFDPCVGGGSLLMPFMRAGYRVLGVDIEDQGFEGTEVKNYLTMRKGEIEDPSLVIMNPPFNIHRDLNREVSQYIRMSYGGRPLLPEVWLMKALDLFPKDTPIVMFTPYGFRLNQTFKSKRWKRFMKGNYPEITSIVSLPKDHFEDILFHSEVLIFNLPDLKGHYFLEWRHPNSSELI